MNAGMFPLPNGQQGGVRKLSGQIGRQANASSINAMGPGAGAVATNISGLTGNTRINLLSVAGRGAARFLAVCDASGAGGNFRVEVIVDGVTIFDGTRTIASIGDGLIPVGYCVSSTTTAIWDYVPFDSSLQVFVTLPGAATAVYLLRVIDIHQ